MEKIWDTAIGTRTFKLAWFATNRKCCLHFWLQGWLGIQHACRKIVSCALITSPHAIWFLTCLYLTHGEGCPSSRTGACFLWSYVMKPGFTPPLLQERRLTLSVVVQVEQPSPQLARQVWHWLLHTPVNVLCVWKMKYCCQEINNINHHHDLFWRINLLWVCLSVSCMALKVWLAWNLTQKHCN